MRKLFSNLGCLSLILSLSGIMGLCQPQGTLSKLPRVDVHCHISGPELMEAYLSVSDRLKAEHETNLEVFINLDDYESRTGRLQPGLIGTDYLEEVDRRYDGRFLLALSDYRIADGLRYSPEELAEWHKRGVVGYKIWVGVSSLIDDPANDPTFTKMEQLGMVGASVHIAQPYPTRWCEDPVKFWQAQRAWEHVLDRHPRLQVVQAHMLDHFNSDEQLDYLRYVLETYPNVNLDLAARFQQFHRMDREKLRNFIIRYADRILFGTDISKQPASNVEDTVARYQRCFQLLETDQTVSGGFFGATPTVGLALPEAVLKKIYYENAVRIYPRVGAVLNKLGYDIEVPQEPHARH